MRVPSEGPVNARIMIIGEAPGKDEDEVGRPFVGFAGTQLDSILKEAGISRGECYITNVCWDRPPNNEIDKWIWPKSSHPEKADWNKRVKGLKGKERPKFNPNDYHWVQFRGRWVLPFVVDEVNRLKGEIERVKPNVILLLGNVPMWATLALPNPYKASVAKWRGSTLASDLVEGVKCIPALHPAFINRVMSSRWYTVADFKRARKESLSPVIPQPNWDFVEAPTFEQARTFLLQLLPLMDAGKEVWLTKDHEIKRTEILCVGIGTGPRSAFCIPFYNEHGFYFGVREHVEIVELVQRVFLHPNCRHCNQNVSFDVQFDFWRQNYWPKVHWDTQIAQNVIYAGTKKSLAFLASLYCEQYVFWKDTNKDSDEDDDKFWKEGAKVNYPKLWHYNCEDAARTFEVMEMQKRIIDALGFQPQMAHLMRLFPHVMKIMLRGVLVDREAKRSLLAELDELMQGMLARVQYMVGWEINPASPQQLIDLFYKRMQFPPTFNTAKKEGESRKSLTCDDEALSTIGKRDAIVLPLTRSINMLRSYQTAVGVCRSKIDADNRWRTSYDISKSTYRFSSSENPLDSGTNLQNVTSGKEIQK